MRRFPLKACPCYTTHIICNVRCSKQFDLPMAFKIKWGKHQNQFLCFFACKVIFYTSKTVVYTECCTLRCRRSARGGQGRKCFAMSEFPRAKFIEFETLTRFLPVKTVRTFHGILHQQTLHLREISVPSLAINFPSLLPVLGALGASRRKSLSIYGGHRSNPSHRDARLFLVDSGTHCCTFLHLCHLCVEEFFR